MTPPQRTLPADVYDALELSALVHGGIGAGRFFDHNNNAPLCAYGHGVFVENTEFTGRKTWEAMVDAAISSGTNDDAVHAINKRHGAPLNARVPFGKWCKELNIVRGS